MIISHKHRYIFFAIPKTGTHSVRQALRAHLGPDDLEQVGLFEQKRFPFPEFANIRHGHIGTALDGGEGLAHGEPGVRIVAGRTDVVGGGTHAKGDHRAHKNER